MDLLGQSRPRDSEVAGPLTDPAPRLALVGLVRALGTGDRPGIDVASLQCVARPPAVTANCRVIVRVHQEMSGRVGRGQHRVGVEHTNVNCAALEQDRVLHTPPERVVGPWSRSGCEPRWPAAYRVDP
jgi:hypothetical protein